MSELQKTIALSVRPPWAGAILLLGKDCENRVWQRPPRYRGPLVIHASKTFDRQAMHPRTRGPLATVLDHVRGAAVGMVELHDVVDNRDGLCQLEWAQPGGYGLLLRNPVIFREPVPMPGQLSLFSVEEPHKEAIRLAIATAETPGRRQSRLMQESMAKAAAAGEEIR